MKKSFPLLALAGVLVAACTSPNLSLKEQLQNPLFAEIYYNDLVDTLTNIEIGQDRADNIEFMKNKAAVARMRKVKESALKSSQEARSAHDRGLSGSFVSASETVNGEVLIVDDMLYTDPTFNTPPGSQLHLYLTSVLDPRDVPFPAKDDTDLGALEHPYGASSLKLSLVKGDPKPRSVVLYDTLLSRIYGFAQLSAGPDAE